MPVAFAAAGGLGGDFFCHPQAPQLGEAASPGLPLFPRVAAQAPLNPTVEAAQHRRSLAEAEVASPAQQITAQFANHALEGSPAIALGQLSDSLLELRHRRRSDAPLTPRREREPQELSFPWPVHRALRLVDFQPQLLV